MIKQCIIAIFSALSFFWFGLSVHASEDVSTDYSATYMAKEEDLVHADLRITLTRLRASVSLKSYSVSFPREFELINPTVHVESNDATVTESSTKDAIVYTFAFSPEKTGKDLSSTMTFSFDQKNILKKRQNLWELTIPPLLSGSTQDSTVRFQKNGIILAPPSIVKPLPVSQTQGEIVWKNVGEKSVYATFGSQQTYKVSLSYTLQNTRFTKKTMSIALPPETQWQRVAVEKIVPLPKSVEIDSDGNYLAFYDVLPRGSTQIQFEGFVTTLSKSQDGLEPFVTNMMSTQKNLLLKKDTFWTLSPQETTEFPHEVKDIYEKVVSLLSYNYARVSAKTERLGASKILRDPSRAVCMEYTDLFIAAARARGIAAREINGFGYAENDRLKPLSLVADVLHSWPEYFDAEKKLWIGVDPTWEDTSHIDYFSSLDLNHIALSIHGQSSVEPKAAGMYKIDETKDVRIVPHESPPAQKKDPRISLSLSKTIEQGKSYTGMLTIENDTHLFIKDALIVLRSNGVRFEKEKEHIYLLAPYQKKEIPVVFKAADSAKTQKYDVEISYNGVPYAQNVVSVHAGVGSKWVSIMGVGVGILLFSLIFLFLKKIQ